MPRRDRLFNVRDYLYVAIDRRWTLLIAVVPLVIVIVLIPAFWSERPLYRWLGIALFIYPCILAILLWIQLLTM
ncbi:MAG TPA: hypothetical protein VHH88_14100 [Verrucomicrobiae bacterium]|nr:hypothetical protein [Verrucomicrobiae bacterium]